MSDHEVLELGDIALNAQRSNAILMPTTSGSYHTDIEWLGGRAGRLIPATTSSSAPACSATGSTLGEHFSVVLTYHAEIPRAASGKYLDLLSEVPE